MKIWSVVHRQGRKSHWVSSCCNLVI